MNVVYENYYDFFSKPTEYHRWFDLKHTSTLVARASAHHYKIKEANFVGVSGALKILRPIPPQALDLNQNKDFPQNPGY